MTGFRGAVREQVLSRDLYRCVRCGQRASNVHHRQPRGMGGTSVPDTAANGLSLCGSGSTGCHGLIERHRAAAQDLGWLVRHPTSPYEVPVWYETDREWRWLADDGMWTYALDIPAPAGGPLLLTW